MCNTIMERCTQAWLALADTEHCRLLRCRLDLQGTQHVDEYGTCDNMWPEQEHSGPVTQGDKTKDRRFGIQIIEWLHRKVAEFEIDQVVIFVLPRMLGALRKTPFGSIQGRLEESQDNLMRLSARELAEHPMVRELSRARQER